MDKQERISILMQGMGITQIQEFFHMIFRWKYKYGEPPSTDVVNFYKKALIPEYVEDFLEVIRQKKEESKPVSCC